MFGGGAKGVRGGDGVGHLGRCLVLHGVHTSGQQLAHIGRLLPGLGAGQLGVAAQAVPGPFAVRLLVAQLPGLGVVGLHAEVQAVAVRLTVGRGLGLQSRQHSISQGAAFDV
ncbi:hypothetical protein D9M71_814010 [compost metagenome]